MAHSSTVTTSYLNQELAILSLIPVHDINMPPLLASRKDTPEGDMADVEMQGGESQESSQDSSQANPQNGLEGSQEFKPLTLSEREIAFPTLAQSNEAAVEDNGKLPNNRNVVNTAVADGTAGLFAKGTMPQDNKRFADPKAAASNSRPVAYRSAEGANAISHSWQNITKNKQGATAGPSCLQPRKSVAIENIQIEDGEAASQSEEDAASQSIEDGAVDDTRVSVYSNFRLTI